MIDALDECSDRKTLLNFIKQLCENKQINVLVTSRREHDIRSVVTGLVDYVIGIKDKQINVDINLHVRRCLRDDPDLGK